MTELHWEGFIFQQCGDLRTPHPRRSAKPFGRLQPAVHFVAQEELFEPGGANVMGKTANP
jgi:hypothetical protein